MFGNALGSAGPGRVVVVVVVCGPRNSEHFAAQVARNLESLVESKDDIGYMAITRPLGLEKMYRQSVCLQQNLFATMLAVSFAGAGGAPTSARDRLSGRSELPSFASKPCFA